MRTEFLCISVLIVALGHKVKLARCKSALKKGKRKVQGVPRGYLFPFSMYYSVDFLPFAPRETVF